MTGLREKLVRAIHAAYRHGYGKGGADERGGLWKPSVSADEYLSKLPAIVSEALGLLESEQGFQPIEGGISEDDADMLFNGMSWEVKFDPRAVTDKRAGFLHATLIIKPRAILGTESENGEGK